MKKIISCCAVAFALATMVHAQNDEARIKSDLKQISYEEKGLKKEKKEDKKTLHKLAGREASDEAKQAFLDDFGNLPGVRWKRQVYFDVASFEKDGQQETAFYDIDAGLVGTTVVKAFADLPQKAQDYINKKYSGYAKGSVIFFDDNEANETNMVLYGRQFKDADNYFVELQKGARQIILQVDSKGDVIFFKRL